MVPWKFWGVERGCGFSCFSRLKLSNKNQVKIPAYKKFPYLTALLASRPISTVPIWHIGRKK